MKRKISTAVVGLSVFSFGLFGVNIGDGGVVKAEHGDVPAPKLETHADLSSKLDSDGDTWAPSYTNTHGEGMATKKESHADFFAPTLEAHGNTGAPALNVGDTPAPKLDSRDDTGGAPALNIGDTGGAPKQEGHTHFPAPKVESHGNTGGAPANSEHSTGW
ncbi:MULTISPECIES: hypothetical protein [Bacillus]|uniref:hypothetical protein n=1 Tax=Bacillus TaxID=1386 RepID=UPI000DF7716D|nr:MULTISPECIES: hypothetical protein [Bacillus]TKH41245.1 hypothetical protein FC690_02365 [Bacillus cereus]